MLLGIRAAPDGSAALVLECNVSSLRCHLVVPKATRTERRKLKEMLKEPSLPTYVRHGARKELE